MRYTILVHLVFASLLVSCSMSPEDEIIQSSDINQYRSFIANIEENIGSTTDSGVATVDIQKVRQIRADVLELVNEIESFPEMTNEQLLSLQALMDQLKIAVRGEDKF